MGEWRRYGGRTKGRLIFPRRALEADRLYDAKNGFRRDGVVVLSDATVCEDARDES